MPGPSKRGRVTKRPGRASGPGFFYRRFATIGLGHELIAQLVELSRSHAKIILYAVPGKEGFDARHGFRRMTTAMAVFQDQEAATARGYLAGE